MAVNVTIENGMIHVISDYNGSLPKRARNLGGDWNGSAWVFDERDLEPVKELYLDIYGEFGDTGAGELATVRFHFKEPEDYISGDKDSIYLCGRQVARAWGRDSGARIGDGVRLSGCEARSGGSMKNWQTRIIMTADTAYIEVKDVPLAMAHRELECSSFEELRAEIITDTIDRAALEKELATLDTRRAEILKLLK